MARLKELHAGDPMIEEAFDDDEAPEMDFHLPDDFNWTQLPDDPAEGAAFEEEPDSSAPSCKELPNAGFPVDPDRALLANECQGGDKNAWSGGSDFGPGPPGSPGEISARDAWSGDYDYGPLIPPGSPGDISARDAWSDGLDYGLPGPLGPPSKISAGDGPIQPWSRPLVVAD
jgi:hypothetical protein